MFSRHSNVDKVGNILDDYNINEIAHVSIFPGTQRVRTMILYATPKTLVSTEVPVAIKITPLWDNKESDLWARNERRIHYFLSQLDAEKVRKVAANLRDTANALKTTKNDVAVDDTSVNAAIVGGSWRNFVPLYDFLIQPLSFSPGSVSGHERLNNMIFRSSGDNSDASFLVEARFGQTLTDYLQSLPVEMLPDTLRIALAQICVNLHLLLAIEFTHADLHTNNVAVADAPDKTRPRCYHLSDTQHLFLEPGTPIFQIFDFGFSRARFKDARKKIWELVPTDNMLKLRLGNTPTNDTSFIPLLDLFQLCTACIVIFATKIDGKNELENIVILQKMFLAVFTRLPETIRTDARVDALRKFVDKFSDGKTVLLGAAKELEPKLKDMAGLWREIYGKFPKRSELRNYALPMDVVLESDLVKEGSPGNNCVDMTIYPLLGPGKVYDPRLKRKSDTTLREATLLSADI